MLAAPHLILILKLSNVHVHFIISHSDHTHASANNIGIFRVLVASRRHAALRRVLGRAARMVAARRVDRLYAGLREHGHQPVHLRRHERELSVSVQANARALPASLVRRDQTKRERVARLLTRYHPSGKHALEHPLIFRVKIRNVRKSYLF